MSGAGPRRCRGSSAPDPCPYYTAQVVLPGTHIGLRASSALTIFAGKHRSFRHGARHRRGTSVAPAARQGAIVAPHPMRRLIFASVVVFIVGAAAPAVARADARSDSREQVEFGIRVAQNGLWNEALYRWQKAVEIDPTYAAAWNNLAIAYEHEGKFDQAKKAYERALELDPKNLMIRQNYDLFKEINDRTKRRSGK